jgi:protein-S-isoprenylcysteine O-methyltransferase Ste14
MAARLKSYSLVLIQFLCLAVLALTGPWLASPLFYLALEMAGIALGLWAIAAMRVGNFNITPAIKQGGLFVKRGPYRFIRHPMYLALLVTTLPLVLDAFTWLRLAIWLILLIDLVVKLNYEERLLAAHFFGYATYQQQTKRLLPFVY